MCFGLSAGKQPYSNFLNHRKIIEKSSTGSSCAVELIHSSPLGKFLNHNPKIKGGGECYNVR